MSIDSASPLSVHALFAERAARRSREQEQEQQLQQRQEEETAAFRKRLETFKVEPANIIAVTARIRRAFERGETEMMLTSFPSSFCSDDGRSVNNPPLNTPGVDEEPAWLGTMPAGVREVYNYWRRDLAPGGFKLTARIISFPGGMPGDVGLFLSWPKGPDEPA
jgi:hypothetical protein